MKNGKYMKREVLNLARFISVMKFRPLSWRMAHPYILTDRLEVYGSILPLFTLSGLPLDSCNLTAANAGSFVANAALCVAGVQPGLPKHSDSHGMSV